MPKTIIYWTTGTRQPNFKAQGTPAQLVGLSLFQDLQISMTPVSVIVSATRIIVVALLLARAAPAQNAVPVERAASREWFRDAQFGMFIHWGVYSQLGEGEWVMENTQHQRSTRTSGSRRRSTP